MKNRLLKFLLSRYKSHKQNACNTSLEHCLSVAESMTKKSKYCFLVSNGSNGWCSSRQVQPIFRKDDKADGNFTIWVGTKTDSKKVDELWDNPKVTITFDNPREDANLIIYGEATIETKPEVKKHYWLKTWELFFPNGPEADDYVAIRIDPSRMEILNFSRNIVPEPFGLKAAVLINHQGQWQMEGAS